MYLFLCLMAVNAWAAGSLAQHSDESITFVAIGDYGCPKPENEYSSLLVKRIDPDFIITLGDNNYKYGGRDTIDENIGRYYSRYIVPYQGEFPTEGATGDNRFFPCLGNHDTLTENAQPYIDYFAPALLASTERHSQSILHYDFIRGAVHFFCLDSCHITNKQHRWFLDRVRHSTSPWKIVCFHHPPYNDATQNYDANSQRSLYYNFKLLGVDLVLCGHIHNYQRFILDDMHLIINGLGGATKTPVIDPEPKSRAYYCDHGVLKFVADSTTLLLEFISLDGRVLDYDLLRKPITRT